MFSIFHRLVAFPESRRILILHVLATPFLALQWGVVAMVPVLLRKHFQASEWEVTFSTSAIAVMSLLAIFWNEAYRRISPRRYLLVFWLQAILPMAGIAWCHRPEMVLVFLLFAAAGMGGMNCLTADILRSCYPPSTRSTAFVALQIAAQFTIMVATYGIGLWLDANGQAFRYYLPAGVLLIGVGVFLLHYITRQSLFQERLAHRSSEPMLTSLTAAYRNMAAVLRKDPVFRRYETAFAAYGLGWMICAALLPFLVVDVLGMDYAQVARSTQTAFQLTLLAMLIPGGRVMNRLGPIRICVYCFALLALYPIGLMWARDEFTLTLVTVVYGIGLTGVNIAWTIGPVTLARDASQAPHYLAIHATLVGFRAIAGQFPAVALYRLTGNIHLPLAIAAVLFAVGAVLMFRLHRDHHELPPVADVPIPPPGVAVDRMSSAQPLGPRANAPEPQPGRAHRRPARPVAAGWSRSIDYLWSAWLRTAFAPIARAARRRS